MTYVDRMLLPGEKIAYRTRLHPMIYVKPVIAFIALTVFAGVLPPDYQPYAAVLLLVILLPYTFLVSSAHAVGDIAVTGQRLMLRQGPLASQFSHLLLHKIVAAEVGSNIAGCGTVRIRMAGNVQRSVGFVRDPEALVEAIKRGRDQLIAQDGG
ncbi:MAG: hypothetical protein H2060_03460 [Azoarcus sp.]|nr:hypothetical protein [Azoarcus sp.]